MLRPQFPQRVRAAVAPILCCGLLALVPFVAEGIYTKEQADRGRVLYDGSCAECHGAALEGETSGPLAGPEFLANWARPELTLDDFYYIVRKTMPKENPGTLTREAYTDIVAYILQRNGFPDGEKEFTADPSLMRTVRFGASTPAEFGHAFTLSR